MTEISIEKMAQRAAEAALDYEYQGKTIREWMKIIAEQEPCDDVVSREAVRKILEKYHLGESRLAEELNELPPVTNKDELKDLFKRVENIERQMREDKEEQLKKLKADLDYAKFCCTLHTIQRIMGGEE